MLDKKFIQDLRKKYNKQEIERKEIINLSNKALYNSKLTIFSLHRNDIEKAKKMLKNIEITIKKMQNEFGINRVNKEGSYKAAVEEYVEAKMFLKVLTNKKIEEIKELTIELDGYLGGICDLTGELVRLSIATDIQNNEQQLKKIYQIEEKILSELIKFDLTGYLRTKYDQAKRNLQKIENMKYEIELRKFSQR